MSSLSLQWPSETLWSQIEPLWPGFSVEVQPELTSTNTVLMERAREGHLQPTLLVAERQTAGRGRLGRHWAPSTPGQALTFSMGVPLGSGDLSGLSLMVGCCVAASLDPQHRQELRIKWPNDLWYHQRKLVGILVEVCLVGQERYVVVGVGINIAAVGALPPPEPGRPAPQPPACVQEWEPDATAPGILARVAPALAQALAQFARAGFAPWQARFAARDALAGRAVWLSDGSVGTACGVSERGGLRVRIEQPGVAPAVREVLSDEISVRPLPPSGGRILSTDASA